MASTNKTPQLGLNQWAAGDPVLREDFNRDNAKVDELLYQAGLHPVVGSFVGDGLPNRRVELGFRPSYVIMTGGFQSGTAIFFGGAKFCNTAFCNGVFEMPESPFVFDDTGFTFKASDNSVMHGRTSSYIAFR